MLRVSSLIEGARVAIAGFFIWLLLVIMLICALREACRSTEGPRKRGSDENGNAGAGA